MSEPAATNDYYAVKHYANDLGYRIIELSYKSGKVRYIGNTMIKIGETAKLKPIEFEIKAKDVDEAFMIFESSAKEAINTFVQQSLKKAAETVEKQPETPPESKIIRPNEFKRP